jgi:hypothetical protein
MLSAGAWILDDWRGLFELVEPSVRKYGWLQQLPEAFQV